MRFRPVVFTHPGADTRAAIIVERIERYAAARDEAVVAANLGTRAYFGLMAAAAAMVGNSSSGIIEAASFDLPVVDIGPRQRGRARGRNVIDVDCEWAAIASAITRATSDEFRRELAGMTNLYGDGRAAERIVQRLCAASLDKRLLTKRFNDLNSVGFDTKKWDAERS